MDASTSHNGPFQVPSSGQLRLLIRLVGTRAPRGTGGSHRARYRPHEQHRTIGGPAANGLCYGRYMASENYLMDAQPFPSPE